MLKRWLDVDPTHWFYRSVLEADRIKIDPQGERRLIEGKTYNVFEHEHQRKVFVFTSEENQRSFEIEDYRIPNRATVLIYIEGRPIEPARVQPTRVHLPNPISSNQEVVVVIQGKPAMTSVPCNTLVDECQDGQCYEHPMTNSGAEYPRAELSQMENYVFDIRYTLNEAATAFGKKLRRLHVTRLQGETTQQALSRVFGMKRDCFTIIEGVIYTSYNLNELPIRVNYNYHHEEDHVVKNLQNERVFPSTPLATYNDRFFPHIHVRRYEFLVILQRMRVSFYNRFTDRGYVGTHPNYTEREITDRERILGRWYDEDLLNMLDEKYLDGCYVIPLYEDGTFDPNGCVTRAEIVVYLHRFIEWALEKFR